MDSLSPLWWLGCCPTLISHLFTYRRGFSAPSPSSVWGHPQLSSPWPSLLTEESSRVRNSELSVCAHHLHACSLLDSHSVLSPASSCGELTGTDWSCIYPGGSVTGRQVSMWTWPTKGPLWPHIWTTFSYLVDVFNAICAAWLLCCLFVHSKVESGSKGFKKAD